MAALLMFLISQLGFPGSGPVRCVRARPKSEDADVFLAALQTCGAAAELFTLITLLLMAAGCQSGCRSLQAQMWPHDFWERGGSG